MTQRTLRLWMGTAFLCGILLTLNAPAWAQTITAEPETVTVAKDAKQGATTITWDAGSGITSVGATLWQQVDGRKETLVSTKAQGSQKIFIAAGETRVFKLRAFIKSTVLASVTVTATGATVSFAGMWIARPKIGDHDPTMTFKFEQAASKVKGYAILENLDNQKLTFDGEVSGSTLKFRISGPFSTGREPTSGEFVMAPDGRSFMGKVGDGSPVIATVLANCAGVWRTAAYPQLLLQQTGNKVVGQLFAGNPSLGVIKEGVVDGNTVRFQIWRPRPQVYKTPLQDVFLGNGELVMDDDGRSFTGTILGVATSGTLIAR